MQISVEMTDVSHHCVPSDLALHAELDWRGGNRSARRSSWPEPEATRSSSTPFVARSPTGTGGVLRLWPSPGTAGILPAADRGKPPVVADWKPAPPDSKPLIPTPSTARNQEHQWT